MSHLLCHLCVHTYDARVHIIINRRHFSLLFGFFLSTDGLRCHHYYQHQRNYMYTAVYTQFRVYRQETTGRKKVHPKLQQSRKQHLTVHVKRIIKIIYFFKYNSKNKLYKRKKTVI